jgi:2-polyprenyl-3-methyl-5-hydroxy-6-metoxy-1,4-benzoquinol methylase
MTARARWEARYAARPELRAGAPSRLLSGHRHLLPAGRAVDIACGDGRQALWLARRGFAVDAIDFAFTALSRLAAAARHEGVAVHPVQADLEQLSLPEGRYAVVVNVRYLQRSLFGVLRRAVAPGGVIVFETFLRAHARLGHPRNPAFLLEPGELRAQFAGFTPLVDEEGCFDTEAGPAFLARLIARRPATATRD